MISLAVALALAASGMMAFMVRNADPGDMFSGTKAQMDAGAYSEFDASASGEVQDGPSVGGETDSADEPETSYDASGGLLSPSVDVSEESDASGGASVFGGETRKETGGKMRADVSTQLDLGLDASVR